MENNISVIIPTYNEKESIAGIISTICKEVACLKEIIVVDDDSPDMTWSLVEQMGEENDKIKLVRRIGRRGLPQAIWEGILASKGEIIAWFDADFSSVPSGLTKLIEGISGYDIVVASRYVGGGKDRRREKMRVVASKLFNKIAKSILGMRVTDLTSGYIVAKREIFDIINIHGIYGEYSITFLYEAQRQNLSINEVPYIWLSRPSGMSKTTVNTLLFVAYGLLYILTVLKLRLFRNV
jgi:dolichol-phosphate mannosyltransferase